MALPEDLLAQRNRLQQLILALETSLDDGRNISELLSSDSDSGDESDDSGHARDVSHEDLEAERQQTQREIEELERTLGADAALVDNLTDSEHGSGINSNVEDSDTDLDLPQDLETCLQMNLVYQEVLKEKLAELERLLNENREQQKELEEQLSGPSYVYPGLPHLRIFLGSFMKPYFKDKLTGLGPPANEETKERMMHGPKPCDEMKIRRWEPWQKMLLMKSIVTDTMKRKLQPKLSKMEYLTTKMSNAEDPEKEALQTQITLLEKDITDIRSINEDRLYGDRHDDHDWDKIANIDFEGFREPDDLRRFWQNYLHPSINKSPWSKEEIVKLADIVETYERCHWDQIAEALGTNRTAFMCFQTYQRYISKTFKKREWSKEEDKIFKDLVEKMRIGNFIPYMQISYFMEGRDSTQLLYRWTCVLDPSLKKGPWTKDEDELLLKAVKKYGCKEWWKIRLEVPGRTDNACRDRYLDCLRTEIKRGAWSDEEVELLKKLVEKHGVGKWSKIAAEFPNRLDCQCMNKWKWMTQSAIRKSVKRVSTTLIKDEPQLKRRRVSRKTIKKEDEDFTSESDTSEEEVPYIESTDELSEEDEVLDESCKQEYVQPDMKEWIPAWRNNLTRSPNTLKTTLVQLPTVAEKSAKGSFWYTILDSVGNPIATYSGIHRPALQKWNCSNDHTMVMVSKGDVNRLLTRMRLSVVKARTTRTKTTSSSNWNYTTNKKSSPKRCKPLRKAAATAQLSYDLMLAIAPWVGNVIMPLPSFERRVCEADIIRKGAAHVPLLKSSVFLLFLQALKIDATGCKKVIEARKHKAALTPRPQTRPSSGQKPTSRSYYRNETVAELLAKRKQLMNHPGPQQSSEIAGAKMPIPPLPRQKSQTSLAKQSASQKLNAAFILPQTFVTQPIIDNKVGSSQNVVQGTLPLLQLGTQDASNILQPALHPAKPITQTNPVSCPATALSTTGAPLEATEEAGTSKRTHKPTMKAQALMDDRKAKLSKKEAATNQKDSNEPPTVAVLPQTTYWILTPAGLMPIAGIQVLAPGMPNNVQMVFQPPAILTPDLLGNNTASQTAESTLSQSPRTSSDNQTVSAHPSSDFPSVTSASVPNTPSVQVSLDNNAPTSITRSAAKVTPLKTNQNKADVPMSPTSSLVPGSFSSGGTSQTLTPSHISNVANNVLKVCSVSAGTSTPSNSSVRPLNSPGPVPVPQSHPVSPVVFQQPVIVNQDGTLKLINIAAPSLPNASPTATAKVTNGPTNCAVPNINKSHPSSISSACSLIPTSEPSSASNGRSNVISPSGFVNSPNILHGLPKDQMCLNPPISQTLPQSVVQQASPQTTNQTAQSTDTTSNPTPIQMTFDPNLMFLEEPGEVKNWMKGDGGIKLPGLEEKLPYLPPFVSSINTLTTLLKGRDSLLKTAVQLLPEEHRDNSDEEAKIAAVREMVSENFKTNQAYLLLKARFLSCFTLPALLATINPDAVAEEDVKPKQFYM